MCKFYMYTVDKYRKGTVVWKNKTKFKRQLHAIEIL